MGFNKKDQAVILKCIQDLDISYDIGWKNFSRNLTLPQALVLNIEKPTTLPILIKQINKLNENKKNRDKIILRVAAGGKSTFFKPKAYSESFSFTPGVEADIIIHLTGEYFNRVQLKDAITHTVEIGPSIQIGELDETLYNKFRLILPTSSLIPHVTLGGMTANAGHGTGRDQPSICGLISAMTICRPDGNIVRIDQKHPDFNVIRGAHLGAFGIVLSFEITCLPAKKLACSIETKNLEELKTDIKSGLFSKHAYVSVMYVPTYTPNEQSLTTNKNVLVIKWQPVALEEKNTYRYPFVRHMGEEIGIRFAEKFETQQLLVTHPNLIPYFMKYIVSKFTVGSQNTNVIGDWPSLAHYQTAFPRDIDDTDFLFNVSEDGNEIISALNFISTTLNSFAKKKGYPITDAIYLRYFSGTQGGLSSSSPQKDKRICAFDIVSHPDIPGYPLFKNIVSQFFMSQLQAKPHWGKSLPPSINYAKLYGKNYLDFKNALNRWYKSCQIPVEKSVFINRFLCQILNLPSLPQSLLDETKKSVPANISSLQLNLIASSLVNFIKTDEGYELNPYALSLIQQTVQLTKPKFTPRTKKQAITATRGLFSHSFEDNATSKIQQSSEDLDLNSTIKYD